MNVFDHIEELETVGPECLAEFQRAMQEEVIPEIVKAITERERLANLIRLGLT